MATKKVEKKIKQLTLFFESKEKCQDACEKLELSLRKVTDIDKSHNGSYSKKTGHYALVYKNGNVFQTSIRAKLLLDEDIFDALSEKDKSELGYIDITSKGWIAP